MTRLQKITSHHTASEFYYWLCEHPEIESVQGWQVNRIESGPFADGNPNRVYSIGNPRVCEHSIDVETVYSLRADINDWIQGQWDRGNYVG